MADETKPNDGTDAAEEELSDEELAAVSGGVVMPVDSPVLQSTSLNLTPTAPSTSSFTTPIALPVFNSPLITMK